MPSHQPEPVRNILAATDLSAAAEAGLAWARELARWHGATLHLVHAVPPLPAILGDEVAAADSEQRLRADAQDVLDGLAAGWRSHGLAVDTRTRLGVPWSVLVAAAEEMAADLLVLATRGHTGLRFLLLGSTSRRVVQRAPCPVLTVHPGERTPTRRPHTLVLPTDFHLDAVAAAEAAVRLLGADREASRFLLHHAWELPPEYSVYSARWPATRRGPEDTVERLRAKLEEVATALGARGFEVETSVAEGSPVGTIVDLATRRRADAIVMGTHGARGFEHLTMGSVAERTVQLAPCPVLTLKPEA